MPAAKPLPPLEVLEEWFDYDPQEGVIRWRKDPPRKPGFAGKEAGRKSGNYRMIRCRSLGGCFLAHRVAFKLATGTEPPLELDHRDGNGSNNRLSNLRVPEGTDNKCNLSLSRRNTSGVMGVSYDKWANSWAVAIMKEGRVVRKRFKSKEDAVAWRLAQEVALHGEFAQHWRSQVS